MCPGEQDTGTEEDSVPGHVAPPPGSSPREARDHKRETVSVDVISLTWARKQNRHVDKLYR